MAQLLRSLPSEIKNAPFVVPTRSVMRAEGITLVLQFDITLISTYLIMSMASHVPFETTLFVRDKCLCLHMQRTARVLARFFDEALRDVGLTNGQFSLLMSLNRPEMPSIGSVASLLATDRTTLTAALKPLERRGLI